MPDPLDQPLSSGLLSKAKQGEPDMEQPRTTDAPIARKLRLLRAVRGAMKFADVPDGHRWVTTEDGHHLLIKGDNEIVGGNPHVLKSIQAKKEGVKGLFEKDKAMRTERETEAQRKVQQIEVPLKAKEEKAAQDRLDVEKAERQRVAREQDKAGIKQIEAGIKAKQREDKAKAKEGDKKTPPLKKEKQVKPARRSGGFWGMGGSHDSHGSGGLGGLLRKKKKKKKKPTRRQAMSQVLAAFADNIGHPLDKKRHNLLMFLRDINYPTLDKLSMNKHTGDATQPEIESEVAREHTYRPKQGPFSAGVVSREATPAPKDDAGDRTLRPVQRGLIVTENLMPFEDKPKRAFTEDEAKAIGVKLGVDWGKVDVEQFRKGLEHEMEHLLGSHSVISTAEELGKTVLAHLDTEQGGRPDYYSRLDEMEKKPVKMAANAKPLRKKSALFQAIRKAYDPRPFYRPFEFNA